MIKIVLRQTAGRAGGESWSRLSEAVRRALIEAEQRRFSDEAVRAAARRIAEDPAERAEAEELDRIFGDPWEDLPL